MKELAFYLFGLVCGAALVITRPAFWLTAEWMEKALKGLNERERGERSNPND